MNKIRLNSLGTQLFLWMLLSTLILLIGLTSWFYRYSTQQIDLRVGEAAERNVNQAMNNFKLLVKSYDSLTKSVMGNPEIQRLLSMQTPVPGMVLDKELSMMSALGSIFYSYSDVKGIHIIATDGSIYSYETTTHAINPRFKESAWYREVHAYDGKMAWGGVLTEPVTLREDRVFLFGRVITNLATTRKIGVLIIEADPKSILASMENLNIKADSRSLVYSDTDRLLVPSGFEGDIQIPSGVLDPSGYTFLNQASDISDSRHLIVTAEDPTLGWKLLNMTPKPVTQVEKEAVRRYFIIVTFTMVLIALVLATLLSRSVSKPIRRIVHEMKRVERGDLSTDPKAMKSYDEINYLHSHFIRMVGQINNLIERVRLATASEKNAQIHALQSQVNPHFLYNTLDMIYWLLDEQRNDKLANLVLSLSRMFRYSSDWRSSHATLKQELEQINHYLSIIQARSDERIQVEHDLDEAYFNIMLPKMTLQPLVENAVIHGLIDGKVGGNIKISTTMTNQMLYIHIEDNGKGIPLTKLNDIEQSLKRTDLLNWTQLQKEEKQSHSDEPTMKHGLTRSGEGLLNVHRRFILEYGYGYGLSIQSEEHVLTTVTIKMPIGLTRKFEE
jgi:two-component system sensor histidine kinase YesM